MNPDRLKPIAGFLFLAAVLGEGCNPRRPDPPAVPSGPSLGKTRVDYEFEAVTTSPNGDSLSYQFDWDDKDSSAWTGFVPSGTPASATKHWTDAQLFFVRARARNADDIMSDWSDPLEIEITVNSPPYTPSTPEGPDRGNPYVPYVFSCNAGDPDGDSIRVRFAWGDDDTSDWSELVPNRGTVSQVWYYSYMREYEVRAQAMDVHGATSAWSEPLEIDISRLKWRFRTGNRISSSPAIAADGTVYVGSWDDNLYAVNPDGTVKWRYRTGGNVESSPAIGSDGTVYVGSADSALHAVNPDGELRWKYETGGPVRSSPRIGADGTVYVGSDDNFLHAVSPDGTGKWEFETGHDVFSSPAIAPDATIYVGSNDGNFYAVNPDGTLKWKYEGSSGYWIVSSPAIGADGTVYYGSKDNHVYALNPDGTLKWKYFTYWVRVEASPAIGVDGTIYIGSHDSNLYALNPDGTVKWKYDVRWAIIGTPAVAANGLIYFGSEDRYLYALRPDGTLRWQQRTGWRVVSSPAIAPDGTIYVGSWDYRLYSLVGTAPLGDTPWPMFGQNPKHTGRRD